MVVARKTSGHAHEAQRTKHVAFALHRATGSNECSPNSDAHLEAARIGISREANVRCSDARSSAQWQPRTRARLVCATAHEPALSPGTSRRGNVPSISCRSILAKVSVQDPRAVPAFSLCYAWESESFSRPAAQRGRLNKEPRYITAHTHTTHLHTQ